MEYRRVRYFLKAAETKNFTRAAAELFVSHQALIKQIQLLEEELGGKLFTRTSRTVSLTVLGQEAYRRFSYIDRLLTKAETDLKQMAGTGSPIRFGIFSAIPKEQVSLLLDEILARCPALTLEPVVEDYIDTRLSLLEGKTDVCLTNSHEQEDWGGFEKHTLLTMRGQVAVSLYHPWAAKDTITCEDMEQETFVKLDVDRRMADLGPGKQRQKEQFFQYQVPYEQLFFEHVPCRQRIQAPNFESLLSMLERGKGFAVIPGDFMQKHFFKLRFFDIPYGSYDFQTAFFYPGKTENRELLNLIEVVKNADLQGLI